MVSLSSSAAAATLSASEQRMLTHLRPARSHLGQKKQSRRIFLELVAGEVAAPKQNMAIRDTLQGKLTDDLATENNLGVVKVKARKRAADNADAIDPHQRILPPSCIHKVSNLSSRSLVEQPLSAQKHYLCTVLDNLPVATRSPCIEQLVRQRGEKLPNEPERPKRVNATSSDSTRGVPSWRLARHQ